MTESTLAFAIAPIFILAGGYNVYKRIYHIVEKRKEQKKPHHDTYIQLFLGSMGVFIGTIIVYVQFGWLVNYTITACTVIDYCTLDQKKSVLIQFNYKGSIETSCQEIIEGRGIPIINESYSIKINNNIPDLVRVNW